MKILLDTHLLLWGAAEPERLSHSARALKARGRADFQVDVGALRRNLTNNGYRELAVTGEHAVAIDNLPPLHKDPFDRMLVAQSIVEGITLLTADPIVAQYPAPVRRV